MIDQNESKMNLPNEGTSENIMYNGKNVPVEMFKVRTYDGYDQYAVIRKPYAAWPGEVSVIRIK